VATHRERIEAAIQRLRARGFSVTEVIEAPKSFGDTRLTLASDRSWVRFTSDRGQLFVEVTARPQGGWYDLGELLALAGVGGEAGPWESAGAAVDELERREALVVGLLGDETFTSKLRARP
jgi:hypothetical protein